MRMTEFGRVQSWRRGSCEEQGGVKGRNSWNYPENEAV